ncbi:flagellar export protein FliJ [Halanaerobaculum tunisiense]
MKEFEFRLQSLLDLREQEEQALEKELFELKSSYNEVKEELAEVQTDKQKWHQKLNEASQQGITAQQLERYRNYITYLEGEIEELALQLEYWQEQVADCQQRLLEKVKQRKVLSKLKERQYESYQEEYLQQRQKLDDEIAINNFNHHGTSSSGLG